MKHTGGQVFPIRQRRVGLGRQQLSCRLKPSFSQPFPVAFPWAKSIGSQQLTHTPS